MPKLYEDLNHLATLNVEALFDRWGLEWKWIDNDNLAFRNPLRDDTSLGSASYNIRKRIGKDFAVPAAPNLDDFAASLGNGWDLVGLARILFHCSTLKEAADLVATDLVYISRGQKLFALTEEMKKTREEHDLLRREQKREYAEAQYKRCKPFVGTVVDEYLRNRGIGIVFPTLDTPIRFHHAMKYTDDGGKTGNFYPVMVLPIRRQPDTQIEGVHITYLKPDGNGKANVQAPKKVQGSQKGNGIWFGQPCETLAVGEGPESTLSVLALGFYTFAVCAINANNLPEVTIPDYVKQVVICPDNDKPGLMAAHKLKKVRADALIRNPPSEYNDWNDYLKAVHGRRTD